jgi:hypothetical protein
MDGPFLTGLLVASIVLVIISLALLIFSILRARSKNGKTVTIDPKKGDKDRITLALVIIAPAFALIVIMLLIQNTTVTSIVGNLPSEAGSNITQFETLFEVIDRSNQTLFNILLPVFSAWVGVVIAFYFGSEQAKKSQETLMQALSPEAKLMTVRVEDALKRFPDTANVQKVTLNDTIEEIIDAFDKRLGGKLTDLLVVDQDDKPNGILYKADLFSTPSFREMNLKNGNVKIKLSSGRIMGKEESSNQGEKTADQIGKEGEGEKTADQIGKEGEGEKTADQIGKEVKEILRKFAKVKPDENLLQARERMYQVSDEINKISEVRCVVIDNADKAIGIFGYDVIAFFMK